MNYSKTVFICVCSPERLSQYKVLHESLKKYCPNDNYILYYGETNPGNVGKVVNISDWVKNSKYKEDWYIYTSLRPKAILDAFNKGYDNVILLGSDTEFFDTPWALYPQLVYRDDAFVTMYAHEPYPDETLYPNNAQIIEVGQVNADLIGFRNTPNSIKFLTWLDKQLENHIVFNNGSYNKIYLDQGWFSLVFSFLNKVEIIRELGYNVANYNMTNRGMHKENNKWVMKDGTPLVLFHYAGLEKGKEENISKHQNRYKAEGDVLEFLREYGRKL